MPDFAYAPTGSGRRCWNLNAFSWSLCLTRLLPWLYVRSTGGTYGARAKMVYITQVHMVHGTGHEHIEGVQGSQDGKSDRRGRSQMIGFIKQNGAGSVKVSDGRNTVDVGVIDGKWLRTHADGKWIDNPLALPHY